MEEEIKQNNILIAKFMNLDESIPHDHQGIYLYHSSWKWLMSVVEKIEIDCKYDVHIYGHYNWKEPNRCIILDWKNKEIVSTSNDSKFQCIFDAVVKFIKWYNTCQKEK